MNRVVEPELLDELPPTDPRAIQSRRDLHRINWWMRNPAIIADLLRASFPQQPPKLLADLGAGDGDLSLQLARTLSPQWTGVEVVLVDRQKPTVDKAQFFTQCQWISQFVIADVFEWLEGNEHFDCIYANLFLHHFSAEQLTVLFRKVSERTNCFIACEPRRYGFTAPIGLALWIIGCNEVTRNDGVISVRAGFSGNELSQLWPDQQGWKLSEYRSGLFSHVFTAQKR